MFRALLDNEDLNLGYISGKIRHSFIQILPGDRVKIKVRHSDSTRGRIIYQLFEGFGGFSFSTLTLVSVGLRFKIKF
uniref:translational initiation factor 1 n=1 Tax=Primula smithiana TaxID=690515 RepID=UPI001FA745A2|nr:translational initiation factor 1 [Primula smithiana]UNA62747.1 translational initiation factor 1 [Primula smithiana]